MLYVYCCTKLNFDSIEDLEDLSIKKLGEIIIYKIEFYEQIKIVIECCIIDQLQLVEDKYNEREAVTHKYFNKYLSLIQILFYGHFIHEPIGLFKYFIQLSHKIKNSYATEEDLDAIKNILRKINVFGEDQYCCILHAMPIESNPIKRLEFQQLTKDIEKISDILIQLTKCIILQHLDKKQILIKIITLAGQQPRESRYVISEQRDIFNRINSLILRPLMQNNCNNYKEYQINLGETEYYADLSMLDTHCQQKIDAIMEQLLTIDHKPRETNNELELYQSLKTQYMNNEKLSINGDELSKNDEPLEKNKKLPQNNKELRKTSLYSSKNYKFYVIIGITLVLCVVYFWYIK